jgi:CheY-like chemotaxis protein
MSMGDILLIDDNPDFREVFKVSLEQAGIKRNVLEASNPIEALEIFNKYRHKIQIVICDFYMPVQNGNELIDMLKSSDTAVIYCLISGDDSVVKKKFPCVDKSFLKENLNELIEYLKHINWKRE